jgi:hypothetical protein
MTLLQLPHHDAQPFAFIASFNMARDASDQAFQTALQDALPRISYVPHIEVSMEGELGVDPDMRSTIDGR